MDHDEVRAELEVAATEPAGIDRLMAGDTPLAASVAAHLAGCPSCTEELARLRRAAILIGDTIRTTPSPALRERTLAYVREYGRVVPGAGSPAVAAVPPLGLPPAAMAPDAPGPTRPDASGPVAVARSPRGTNRLAWVAAIAAALVVAIGGTAVVLDNRFSERLAAQEAGASGLSRVTAAAVALSAEPDVMNVALEATPDSPAGEVSGTLAYSAGSADLVVIASGLTEPAADREYRCWVEVDGARTSVGKMFFGGDLAFWAGRVEAVTDLQAGAVFGVTLVDAGGDALDGPAVLAGTVGG
jgi:hypothetical protein